MERERQLPPVQMKEAKAIPAKALNSTLLCGNSREFTSIVCRPSLPLRLSRPQVIYPP
jgi:hypothetical protein